MAFFEKCNSCGSSDGFNNSVYLCDCGRYYCNICGNYIPEGEYSRCQICNKVGKKLGYIRQKSPANMTFHRPPISPPYHNPEYIEFLKWKKENDPEYAKFKQEKARKR